MHLHTAMPFQEGLLALAEDTKECAAWLFLCLGVLQAGTRFFTRPVPENEQLTIYYGFPLLDMANHNNSCPHFMEFGPCLSNPTRECAFFTAGADVDSGQEVCFWYGHLLPDRAFLEYGFLPAEAVAGASKPRKQKVKRNRAAAAAEAAANGGAQNGTATAAPKRKRARKAVAAADALLPAVPLFGIDRHDFDAANPLPKLQAPPHDFISKCLSDTYQRVTVMSTTKTAKLP